MTRRYVELHQIIWSSSPLKKNPSTTSQQTPHPPSDPPTPPSLLITTGRSTMRQYTHIDLIVFRVREFSFRPLWAKMTNRIIIRQQKKQIYVHLSSITFDLHNTITIYIHTYRVWAHCGLKFEKKWNLGKPHCLLQTLKSTFLETFSNGAAPKGPPKGIKNFKMLILAFEVITNCATTLYFTFAIALFCHF